MFIKEYQEKQINYNLFIDLETISCKTLKRFNCSGYGNLNTFSTIQYILNKAKISIDDRIIYTIGKKAFVYGYILPDNGFKISLIITDPKYSRQGLSSQLLMYLQNKYSYLSCDVKVFNIPSLNLFIKHNFSLELKNTKTSYRGFWSNS